MWTLIKLGLLVLIVLAITGYLVYLRLRGRLEDLVGKVVTVAQPDRVRLVRDREVEWDDRAAVAASVHALRAEGFRTITVYRIEEMPDVKLVALAHPHEGLGAVVYEHGQAGVWIDVVATYQDGSSLTASNAPEGGKLAQPPRHPKVYRKKAAAARLVRVLKKRLGDAPLTPCGPASFVELFERAYAEEMAWRRSQSGEEEVEELERDPELDRRCEPLFAAIEAGHPGRLAQLLEAGVAPEGRDAKGRTPLIAAAAKGQLELVQVLLEAGADVDARAPGRPGQPEIEPGEAMLRAAEEQDDPTAKKIMQGIGALAGGGAKPLQVTALTAAIETGNAQVVTALAEAGTDLFGPGPQTPLQFAVELGDPDVVRALLDAGASPIQPGPDGETPLMTAAQGGSAEIVRMLLDADADPDVKVDGETAITVGATFGNREVVDLLSPLVKAKDQKKAEKLLADVGEETPDDPRIKRLMTAAHNGVAPMVMKLLAEGLHPDAMAEDDMQTALMLAAEGGHVDVLQALIAGGADVNRSTAIGTALERAASSGFMNPAHQRETLRTLVAAGASLDPLDEEARSGVVELMAEGASA